MCPANDSHDSSFVQIKKLGWRSRESPTMQTFYKDLFLSCMQFLLKFYGKFQTCEFTETALCDISFLRNFPKFSNQTFFPKTSTVPFLSWLNQIFSHQGFPKVLRTWVGALQNLMGVGGAKMLLKNTCEGVHLLVRLSALCLDFKLLFIVLF